MHRGIHIPSKVSELENDKGYLTEHQSLENYYTKPEVDTKIADAITGGTVDLSNYYTKGETDTAISDAISAIPPTDFSNYYNKTETENLIDTAVGNISIPDVSTKADKEHTHSINDITDYVAPEIPSLDGYATEQYVNDAIANIDIPEPSETDLSNYYTKEEVNGLIPYVPSNLSELNNDMGYIDEGYLGDYAKQSDIPKLDGYATETYVQEYVAEHGGSGEAVLGAIISDDGEGNVTISAGDPISGGGVTAEEVQAMIDASLGVIENGSY